MIMGKCNDTAGQIPEQFEHVTDGLFRLGIPSVDLGIMARKDV